MSSVILSDNRFLDGLPTTPYTAAGYNVLNVRDGRTYTSWRSDRAGTQYITVDCGTPKGADTLGLAGTNFKGLSGTYIAVESSDNGSAWTSRLSAVELSYSTLNRAYLKTFLGATARWWRVMIQTSSVPPQVAILMLGMRIGFPRAPDAPFAPIEAKRIVEASKSKTGQLIGVTSRYTELSISPRWTTIEFDFIENEMLPFFREYGGGMNPFFWAWDIFHRPEEVYLVRLTSSHVHNPRKANGLFYESFLLDMEGVIE